MIFVDTNVFVYAVGGPHPLKRRAMEFFEEARNSNTLLFTSAEVLQELLYCYLPVGRIRHLEAALSLVNDALAEVWPLERGDVDKARALYHRHPDLQARDLCYLASCQRRGISTIMTFDQPLLAAASA